MAAVKGAILIPHKDIEPLLKSLTESVLDGMPTFFIESLTAGNFDEALEIELKTRIVALCGKLCKSLFLGKSIRIRLTMNPNKRMLEAYIVALHAHYLGAYYAVMPEWFIQLDKRSNARFSTKKLNQTTKNELRQIQ